ncbi:MAG: OmpH family outer membrane protein [Bacteroidales bacterium]|nr:OmpH family outer membrane protein [Bacteroidales bacterium]
MILVSWVVYYFTVPQTAFLNVNDLYNKFDYKVELEKEYDSVQKRRTEVLDSLNLDLKSRYAQISNLDKLNEEDPQITAFIQKRDEYNELKKKFEGEAEEIRARLSNMIWEQLNQYIKEYGYEQNYTFIYGAKGDGTIMYAQEGVDITSEVVEFVNSRYDDNE